MSSRRFNIKTANNNQIIFDVDDNSIAIPLFGERDKNIKYIEKSLNIELFDNIIRCFKINDEIIEYKRTTNDKTYYLYVTLDWYVCRSILLGILSERVVGLYSGSTQLETKS